MDLSPSTYRFLADALVTFHFAFVAFVVVGGLLVLRWRRVMWFHLPAVAWGVFVEFSGWICPLTPWENRLRALGDEVTYEGGFVDHYIMPVLYPEGLTRDAQYVIGSLIFLINAACYGVILYRHYKARRHQQLTAAAAPGPDAPDGANSATPPQAEPTPT